MADHSVKAVKRKSLAQDPIASANILQEGRQRHFQIREADRIIGKPIMQAVLPEDRISLSSLLAGGQSLASNGLTVFLSQGTSKRLRLT